MLEEAKKRNPAIRTYGLAWGVPGWIGDAESPAGSYYSADNIEYHLSWLDCARNAHGVEIDYLGIWNERGADPTWTVALRAALDAGGYLNTRIVSADSGWEPAASDMASNAAYAAAVDILGAHYPGEPPAAAYGLNKTLFASEMWNLGFVNDWPGAMQLSQDLAQQAQWGLSSSILWCLIYSWYAPLPFSRVIPGTNAGAGHSILTAAEPWGGNYQLNPTIHAMAHHTQFAAPGWLHLARGTPGMGPLPRGGALVTRFNPRAPGGALEFSVTAHTVGAAGAQDVVLALAPAPGQAPPPLLRVWRTTEGQPFARLADVADAGGGTYALTLAPNAFYSLTTTEGQGPPSPSQPIPASAPFPFPYADDFEGYAEGAYAKYFCDEGGAFVVAPVPAGFSRADGSDAAGSALYQLVTKVPIVWCVCCVCVCVFLRARCQPPRPHPAPAAPPSPRREKNPDPYTLIGDFNEGGTWKDYAASALLAIDPSATPPGPAPGPLLAAVTQPCAGSGGAARAQAFALPASAWPAQLQSAAFPGQCLGATGATLYPGALDVGLVPCAASPLWRYDNATRALQLVGSDSCLDVLSGNASAGARVIAFKCKGGGGGDAANQVWGAGASAAGAGDVAFTSALDAPPLCLGIAPLAPGPAPSAPYVFLSMAIAKYERNGPPPSGYTLRVASSANASVGGAWALQFAGVSLAEGLTAAPLLPGVFHAARVSAKAGTVTASWDGAVLASVSDARASYGMAAVGSGWHGAWFDAFEVSAA